MSQAEPQRLADDVTGGLAKLRDAALEGDYDFAQWKTKLASATSGASMTPLTTTAAASANIGMSLGAKLVVAGVAAAAIAAGALIFARVSERDAFVAPTVPTSAPVTAAADVAAPDHAAAVPVVDDVAPPVSREASAPAALPQRTRRAAKPLDAPVSTSTLAAELELYERGMSALNAGDVERALAVFEEHNARWPASQLRPEVAMSKLDALLRANRVDEARALGQQLLVDDALAGRHREIREAVTRARSETREENSEQRELKGEHTAPESP